VTDAIGAAAGESHEPDAPQQQPSSVRRAVAVGVVIVALGVPAGVLALSGGSHHAGGRAGASARAASAQSTASSGRQRAGSAPTGAAAGTSASAGTHGRLLEVADPQEASSYPAPATVHHRAAKTPSRAGEAIVAAGAPSDAEVRRELAQMQAVERSAKRAQRQTLTPIKGGNSIGGNGALPIPPSVPEVVQRVIAGANAIADFPYVFGGGHGSFVDNAYDCSGSVSYALAAGGLLSAPETSGELESWGAPGAGRYVTVFAAAGHTYMYVDGVLYDTAGRSGVFASRWQVGAVNNAGYVARHWPGL
jgi:cell wall-associated NlpC family hydrolase